MLSRSNSVVFIASYLDACALWRCFIPHLNLPGSSFFIFREQPNMKLVAGHDTVVVQRMCTQPQFDFMKLIKSIGMKIIMDLDDNVWQLPEYNPVQNIFHAHGEGFKHCLRAADVISLSTKDLEAAVRKHVRPLRNAFTGKEIPIIITENKIDERFFGPIRKREELVVGWSGSSSHVGDLLLIEEAVQTIKAERPDVTFQMRGCHPPEALNELVEFRQWTPVAEFGARMPTWGWSVGLAPVVSNDFNDAKSCIKILEAAYCRIPCLASWVSAYEKFCFKDKDLKWLLCASSAVWTSKLRDLVNDQSLREFYGQKCYQVMKQYYSWTNGHEGWERLLEVVKDV